MKRSSLSDRLVADKKSAPRSAPVPHDVVSYSLRHERAPKPVAVNANSMNKIALRHQGRAPVRSPSAAITAVTVRPRQVASECTATPQVAYLTRSSVLNAVQLHRYSAHYPPREQTHRHQSGGLMSMRLVKLKLCANRASATSYGTADASVFPKRDHADCNQQSVTEANTSQIASAQARAINTSIQICADHRRISS
jgi:hypothetical protein